MLTVVPKFGTEVLIKIFLKLLLAMLTTSKLYRLELLTNDGVLTFQYSLELRQQSQNKVSIDSSGNYLLLGFTKI